MPATPHQEPVPTTPQGVLQWLAKGRDGDALSDLAPLRQHVRVLLDPGTALSVQFELIALFRPRAAAAAAAARPLLLETTLPVPRQLRGLAKALSDVEGILAAACMTIVRTAPAQAFAGLATDRRRLSDWALGHLAAQLEIALLTASAAPPGLWTGVQTLYHLLHRAEPADGGDAAAEGEGERTLKAMLALAAAQPEAFAPRQIALLGDFVGRRADSVQLAVLPPEESGGWYWLEATRDLPPVAFRRRPPPRQGGCLFFACTELGRLVGDLAGRLGAGESPAQLGLGDQATAAELLAALRQAQPNWSMPPKRLLTRRRQNYAVEVCTDFATLWQHIGGARDLAAPETAYATSDWMVINESPGGYAIMSVSGGIAGIQSGDALGLRPGAGQPWSVCLVRWARSDNPEHLELGLELIAPAAQAAQIVARKSPGHPQAALLLPSLSRLDRRESLLAPRGTYASGGFTLLQDIEGRIRIAYCLPGALLLQTNCVEAYEFERDPLPL